MNLRRVLVLTFSLLHVGSLARTEPADENEWRKPLSNRSQFAPALLFIHMNPERGTVLPKGTKSLTFDFDYSNTLVSHSNDEGESLLVDMEHLAAEVLFEAGLGRGFELDVALPLFVMYGGFLDPFISGFHRAFGFPNATREETPHNLFQYHYRVADTPILERSDGATAIGDITLQVKKALVGENQWELAARGAVKLPSGSRANLTGSGKADLGIGLAASRVGRRYGGYFNLNYHLLGKPDGLDTSNHLSIMGAVDWRFKPTLAAVLQYQQLEPFLSSGLRILDQSARQIVLGLRWRRSEQNQFEWRFAEDLSSTNPDFTFAFQWTINWAAKKKESEGKRPGR